MIVQSLEYEMKDWNSIPDNTFYSSQNFPDLPCDPNRLQFNGCGVTFPHGTMAWRPADSSRPPSVESVNVRSHNSTPPDAVRGCKRKMCFIFIVSVDKTDNNCV